MAHTGENVLRGGLTSFACRRAIVVLLACSMVAVAQAPDRDALLHQADNDISQGRFDEARAEYEQAIRSGAELNGDLFRCRNIAQSYLRSGIPNLQEAIRWLDRAVTLDPDNDDTRATLADTLLRVGSADRAAAEYRTLTTRHPSSSPYVIGLAAALRSGGKLDEAQSVLSTTLAQYPTLKSVRLEYARVLAYEKQYDRARIQYEEVLKADPRNLIAEVGVAKLLSWQGRQEEALAAYERVLQHNPSNYDALVGKAFSLLWMGRSTEARSLLISANQRYPDDSDVREALLALGVAPSGGAKRGSRKAPVVESPADEPRHHLPPQLAARTAPATTPGETHRTKKTPNSKVEPFPRTDRSITAQPQAKTPPAGQQSPALPVSSIRWLRDALIGSLLVIWIAVLGAFFWRRYQDKRLNADFEVEPRLELSNVSKPKDEADPSEFEEYARVIPTESVQRQEQRASVPVVVVPHDPLYPPVDTTVLSAPERAIQAATGFMAEFTDALVPQVNLAASQGVISDSHSQDEFSLLSEVVAFVPAPPVSSPSRPVKPTNSGSAPSSQQSSALPLSNRRIVLVGCGVMVGYYRHLFRSHGAEVSVFKNWYAAADLINIARADVVLINGETEDGLGPENILARARKIETRFKAILIALGADEDAGGLDSSIILHASLADDEVIERILGLCS